MTNIEIAQEISNRIGNSPIPFDSVYSIALQIYNELGGEETQFDSVYSILLEILPLVVSGKDSVVDVDVLPDADLNKGKLVRYEGNLYYAKPSEIKAVKFTALEDGSSVGLYSVRSTQTFESSLDGVTWNTFDLTTTISLNKGESVFIRGIYTDVSEGTSTHFIFDGKIKLSGNINTLWDYTAEDLGENFQLKQSCGYMMFADITIDGVKYNGLYDVSELYLPSKKLANSCYYGMFYGQPITTAPELPAENLENLGNCYRQMFYNCKSLATPQPILPLYNLNNTANVCYSMFSGCENLKSAPVLPSPTISNSTYRNMFKGCTNLNYIKCLATDISATNCTKDWTTGVASTGTFVKASSMNDWTTGVAGIPEGWTVVNDDTVPEFNYEWHGIYKYEWMQIATEQYVDDAISAIPQLEAGQNIEIADDKIAAKGYFYDDEKKEELKSIDDIIKSLAEQPLGLKISGVAGATTYTYTDDFGGMFSQIIQAGYLPGVGATYQTANGKSGIITAVDSTTITFEETLDVENALTNEPVDYVVYTTQLFSFAEGIYDYVEMDISVFDFTLSGAAGATTYTYDSLDMDEFLFLINHMLRLQDGRSAKCVSVDTTNHTITFESTFDAENALTNEPVVSSATKNIASGKYSHVEGGGVLEGVTTTNTASGMGSHAEGNFTTASGEYSHAEGGITTASGEGSHAEGRRTVASGMRSHAEGNFTTASGEGSHAEGIETTASGEYSHTEGLSTLSQNLSEHAEGSDNVSHKTSDTYGDSGNTQHSVGIGTNKNSRKNAFEIMQNGDVYVYGVGGYQGTDTKVQDATINTLQEYIASLEARIAALENPNA